MRFFFFGLLVASLVGWLLIYPIAIVTGMKTNDGLISVNERVARGDFRAAAANGMKTILERAADRGMATGVVTTTRITHATPAACYAHSPDRDWESDADQPDAANEAGFPDIARQLIEFSRGDGIEVALGGGREKFLPRLLAWKQVVLGAVRDALATLKAHGVKLPPPFSAEVIACWISEFWLGMEFADLLGAKEEQVQHRAALDAMQELLEELDARVQKRPQRRRK